MEILESGKKSPEVISICSLQLVSKPLLRVIKTWRVFLLPGLLLQFSLPLAPTSTPSPGCQLILMLLCTFPPACSHGPALTCWSHCYSSPTQLCPGSHTSACSSLALPPLAGNHLHSAFWGSVVVSMEKVTLLLWPSLCISFFHLTLCEKTLIAWESLINPNDFIHDFLLILNQLSCLLTCRMTNPLSQSIFLEELLRKLCKSQ